MHDYVRDGAEIYRRSFAIIRAESDLARFSPAEERVAVRIIHACGMTEIARDIVMSPGFADNARWALVAGAPILCDSRMVANGITRARLPADHVFPTGLSQSHSGAHRPPADQPALFGASCRPAPSWLIPEGPCRPAGLSLCQEKLASFFGAQIPD